MPTDYVQVVSTQGAAGATVSVPITIHDVALLDVTGVDLTVVYDATILMPTSDVNGTTAFAFGDVVTPSWSMEQNVVTPGQLEVVMGGAFDAPLTGAGVLAYVAFDVDPAATPNATSALSLTRADLNEGLISSTAVDGVFTVVSLMYGDVTGNGTLGGYDGSWVLEHAVQANMTTPVDVTFPIEIAPPIWATLPLAEIDADAVADVDGDGDITAMDASFILQKAVSIITSFPVEGATAPAGAPIVGAYGFRASATSQRPGARIVVSLDASGIAELYAGEVALGFDPALLRLVDVAMSSSAEEQPLLVHRVGDGHVAVAFASARPIDAGGGVIDIMFNILRSVARPESSAIRASHLRLNGSRVDTAFEHAYRVEPYTNRLMANYPNPFNPETWIPFELAQDADVAVRIYGMGGRLVRTLELGGRAMGEYTTREHAAYWDGANDHGERVASGVYVYELTAGDYHSLRRMVVRK
ncbi:hypothetical protein CMK11_20590 [Candidatus Poribacteria bacterium]|nr:hypothetical protein [Candidatus Poribacteria bacterium]